jgi:hypothetical protein
MDMTGERRIAAPREQVWAALNDTEVLKSAIPGCDSLIREGETVLKATASLKIGPISAKFGGKVNLLDLDPPNGYRIEGEGQGGVAGFAKGGATVTLEADGDATVLRYTVKAQVGGKIAQLGARLIDATAKQMADAFFDRFGAMVAVPEPDIAIAEAPARPALPPIPSPGLIDLVPREPLGLPLVAWGGGAVFAAILALMLLGMLK